jgi:hypothetical protein
MGAGCQEPSTGQLQTVSMADGSLRLAFGVSCSRDGECVYSQVDITRALPWVGFLGTFYFSTLTFVPGAFFDEVAMKMGDITR